MQEKKKYDYSVNIISFLGFLLFGAISVYFYYANIEWLLLDAIPIPSWLYGIPTAVLALLCLVLTFCRYEKDEPSASADQNANPEGIQSEEAKSEEANPEEKTFKDRLCSLGGAILFGGVGYFFYVDKMILRIYYVIAIPYWLVSPIAAIIALCFLYSAIKPNPRKKKSE